MRSVRLRMYVYERFSIRESGLPHLFIGEAWRSSKRQAVSMVLPGPGRGSHHIETRKVLIVKTAAEEWVPASWRQAARRYSLQWPESAGAVVGFALLTREERAQHIAMRLRRQADEVQKYASETPPGELADELSFLYEDLLPWTGDYQVPAMTELPLYQQAFPEGREGGSQDVE